MAVVVGTAGHIDHGKTALLRALTGIDADRLPEERRRGMTIDVGYAHLALDDGSGLDFVDVPGHDRLVGNMLVGAGEIDAALLVVAADDGPRAQTLEHLELLDALGIANGLAVVSKADMLRPDDPRRRELLAAVEALLGPTCLAGSPIIPVSAVTGEGLPELRAALAALRDRVLSADGSGPVRAGGWRLAVDRAFSVRGRGAVVTGSLRGGRVRAGAAARVMPEGSEVRVREVQVHGRLVEGADGGRTALNLAGVDATALHRGQVVTADAAVASTDRLLALLHPVTLLRSPGAAGRTSMAEGGSAARRDAWPPAGPLRLHLGTDQAEAVIDRQGRTYARTSHGGALARLRLDRPIAARPGDRLVLRRSSPAATVAGGTVLDVAPPLGPSRRRGTTDRLLNLADAATPASYPSALLDLHGALPVARWLAAGGSGIPAAGPLVLAGDVRSAVEASVVAAVAAHHEADPASVGLPLDGARRTGASELRRRAAARAEALAAATSIVDALVASRRLARTGDRVHDPERAVAVPPALAAAMARLVAALDVPMPPPFRAAVAASACPPEGVRALESSGRIVRLEPDLAYAAAAYGRLEAQAMAMAAAGPLSPADFRDSTGTSRRYALAILEDLDRRGMLRRTADGHVPGPRAPGPPAARSR